MVPANRNSPKPVRDAINNLTSVSGPGGMVRRPVSNRSERARFPAGLAIRRQVQQEDALNGIATIVAVGEGPSIR